MSLIQQNEEDIKELKTRMAYLESQFKELKERIERIQTNE